MSGDLGGQLERFGYVLHGHGGLVRGDHPRTTEPSHLLLQIVGHAHDPLVGGDAPFHRLLDPESGVGLETHSLAPVVLFHGPDEGRVSLLDEIHHGDAVGAVLARDVHHEVEVSFHEVRPQSVVAGATFLEEAQLASGAFSQLSAQRRGVQDGSAARAFLEPKQHFPDLLGHTLLVLDGMDQALPEELHSLGITDFLLPVHAVLARDVPEILIQGIPPSYTRTGVELGKTALARVRAEGFLVRNHGNVAQLIDEKLGVTIKEPFFLECGVELGKRKNFLLLGFLEKLSEFR